MLAYRNLVAAFRTLGVDRDRPVIAHTSLSAFGELQGGAETMLGALLAIFDTLIMPAFTYQTMITPEVGPPDNGIKYGTGRDANKMTVVFHPEMPVDRVMGVVPEALRQHPEARRSLHPILSFTGINAEVFLESQSYAEPLGPIRGLTEAGGWVLLVGVDHTRNTSIHYAERLAGRKQFIRWALTRHGIRACPGWPGCSGGFQALAPLLESVTRQVHIGSGLVQAIPLPELVETARAWIARDPLVLLCRREDCERCNEVREDVRVAG
jgi:aminoglycoside 3-N-acetyltransferase